MKAHDFSSWMEQLNTLSRKQLEYLRSTLSLVSCGLPPMPARLYALTHASLARLRHKGQGGHFQQLSAA